MKSHCSEYRFAAGARRRAVSLLLGLACAVVQALAADADHDGLDDAFENNLMNRFAPVVRLHPSDDYRPSSVPWYLARVQMRYHHAGCSDCQILNRGLVNAATLLVQVHEGKDLFCIHNGNAHSSRNTTPEPTKVTDFFLQIPDDGSEQTTRRGDLASAVCYAHVRRAPSHHPTMFDIQYWFFYPYNGDLPYAGHEGDWEHITVRVESNGQTIHRIFYDAHGEDAIGDPYGKWFASASGGGTGYSLLNGRPIVYSAWHSHASYPEARVWLPPDYAADETADGGPVWDCLRAVVNLGEADWPMPGSEWIWYSGRWGEIGVPGVGSSGPEGPAFKGHWVQDPVAEDDPADHDWIFVDRSHSTHGSGTWDNPFKEFADGVGAVPDRGTIWIAPGSYSAVGTYSKPMTWRAPAGGVTLGN